jgi:hypothetical protein
VRGEPDREVAGARAELENTARARSEERFDDGESLRRIWRPVSIRGCDFLVAELDGEFGRKVSWFGSTRLSQGLPRSRRSFAMTDRHRESERRTNTNLALHPDLAAVYSRDQGLPASGTVPTAQWNGSAMKNVPSASAWVTAVCHSASSAGLSAASIRSSAACARAPA